MLAPAPNNSNHLAVFLTVPIIACMLWLVWQQRDNVFTAENDFKHFYVCAGLGPELFDDEVRRTTSVQLTGSYAESQGCTRLPAYYAAISPLRLLPYMQAYAVWQALSACAAIAFVLLWPLGDRGMRGFLAAASLPVWLTLMNAQDLTFVILAIAVAWRLYAADRHYLSGLAWSLCAAKYHLFLLLPLALVGRRRWSVLGGFATGCVGIVLLSAAVAGVDWPWRYAEVIFTDAYTPGLESMPNLRGVTVGLPSPEVWELGVSASVVMLVWILARRTELSLALAAALLGGLLISRHAYPQDATMLLPVGYLLWKRARKDWPVRSVAALALAPPTGVLLLMGRPYSTATILALLAGLVLLVATEAYSKDAGTLFARRQENESRPQESA